MTLGANVEILAENILASITVRTNDRKQPNDTIRRSKRLQATRTTESYSPMEVCIRKLLVTQLAEEIAGAVRVNGKLTGVFPRVGLSRNLYPIGMSRANISRATEDFGLLYSLVMLPNDVAQPGKDPLAHSLARWNKMLCHARAVRKNLDIAFQ
jgi:hypothetical protein